MLHLVGLGDESTQTIECAPDSIQQIPASPIVDPRLVSDVEDERIGKLQIEVREGRELVYSDVKNFSLAGKDDFPMVSKSEPLFYLLATRVQPKSRLVNQVVAQAGKLLGPNFAPGLGGYTGTSDAHQKQVMFDDVKKIYKTIQAMGFTYVNTPISFEAGYQRIKSPTDALRTRTGNCIDGTLVFASCICEIGYQAILVIIHGHAFVIAAMPTSNPNITADVRARLFLAGQGVPKGKSPLGIYAAFIPIETTVLQGKSSKNAGLTRTTFEESVSIATSELQKSLSTPEIWLVDVGAWREKGLLPISDSQ